MTYPLAVFVYKENENYVTHPVYSIHEYGHLEQVLLVRDIEYQVYSKDIHDSQ